jgi:hypothetical protein
MEITKDYILGMISDMMADFLYYDRKEDSNVPVGAIEEAIRTGVISIDEMVEQFKDELDIKGT